MSIINFNLTEDVDKQFDDRNKCITDYMTKKKKIQISIFRNYLNLYCQVFNGLKYLKDKGIVHRDIKCKCICICMCGPLVAAFIIQLILFVASNIFVHQRCKCEKAVLCICTDTNNTSYVIGDLDLLCYEKEGSTIKLEEWKMTQHDPAGTTQMKPPEVDYIKKAICS